ncbi:hypothetical protein Hanom_Chr04g00317571 [Helianthus anomalus]
MMIPFLEETSVPDSNEQEEVVSSVHGKQNKLFLDLNTHPPGDDSYYDDEPCYPAQQGYPDYGYGCEYSYVQQHYPDGYGEDGGHQIFISLSNSQVQQNYPDVRGYGGEAPPIPGNPYFTKHVSNLFCYVRQINKYKT